MEQVSNEWRIGQYHQCVTQASTPGRPANPSRNTRKIPVRSSPMFPSQLMPWGEETHQHLIYKETHILVEANRSTTEDEEEELLHTQQLVEDKQLDEDEQEE